jgi:hypothetical protein
MADKYSCLACGKDVTATKGDRYRSHTDGDGASCEMASEPIPEHILAVGPVNDPGVPVEGVHFAVCPQCERKVQLTRLGYFEPHDQTLRGGDRCPVGGVRAKHARKVNDVLLPGDEKASPVPEVGDSVTTAPHEVNLARDPMPDSTPSSSTPETSSGSPTPSPEPGTSSDAPGEQAESAAADAVPPLLHLAPLLGDGSVLQPFSHIFQPFPVPPRIRLAESMSDEGKEMATRLREIFYAYTNRNASDNRGAQRTLGPSEVGSPCDRQIAMKLLGVTPVNPQEGWAPFVGTAVHAELAKMFEWANGGGSGRFVTEMRVGFGNPLVPYGTLDLLDRVLYMVDDHKLMGRWSLDKLIQQGPSETYRKQIQVYGLGAELAGEKVKKVAIIGWPRQESSLDKLYVHVEKYDRKIAEEALKRVERIAAQVQEIRRPDGLGETPSAMSTARQFDAGDDCKWCVFHLKNDKEFKRGCPGK